MRFFIYKKSVFVDFERTSLLTKKLFNKRTYHIGKVECLAHKVSSSVVVVHMQSVDDILNETTQSVSPVFLRADNGSPDAICDHSYLAFLPAFPHPVRQVKQDSLVQAYVLVHNHGWLKISEQESSVKLMIF